MFKFSDKVKFHLEESVQPRAVVQPEMISTDSSSNSVPNEVLKARETISAIAKDYYVSLWLWFFGTSLAAFLFSSIGLWASNHHGWQAGAVEFVCEAAAALCLFTVLMFVTLIYAWHKRFKVALDNAYLWVEDPELFKTINREAIGPIPWTK